MFVTNKPSVSFGLISDIQYADVDDAWNYEQTKRRMYRGAMKHLKDAVDIWKSNTVDFAIQMGDLIDGKNKNNNNCNNALNLCLDVFNVLEKPVYHVLGNHELYCFERRFLAESQLNSKTLFDSSASNKFYYSFNPCEKFRIVVLDTYDCSMLGVDNNDEDYKRAKAIITSKNLNSDLNSYNNLPRKYRHYCMFNGGIGKQQLLWLNQILEKAKMSDERVLVIGHIPLYEPATDPCCLLFNWSEVLNILHIYSHNVMAYLAGHDHSGGYAIDKKGILHVTFDGIVEVPSEKNSFAIAHVYHDKLILEGYGMMKTFIIHF